MSTSWVPSWWSISAESPRREQLEAAFDGITLYGRRVADGRTPTFAIAVDGVHPDTVAAALGDVGIFVWSGDYYAYEVMHRLGKADGGLFGHDIMISGYHDALINQKAGQRGIRCTEETPSCRGNGVWDPLSRCGPVAAGPCFEVWLAPDHAFTAWLEGSWRGRRWSRASTIWPANCAMQPPLS